MGHLIRTTVALALVLLSGCTNFIRLAYDNADMAARYMADDWLAPDDAQAEALRERIAKFHRWHRAEEAPRYAAMLDDAATKLRKRVQPDDVSWLIDTIQTRYRVMLEQAIDEVTPLMGTLTAANVQRLRAKLDESNRKFERDNAVRDPAAHRAERQRVLIKRAHDWLGDVTPAQEARIARYVAASPQVYVELLEERRRRQAAVIALLEEPRAPQAAASRLKSLLVTFERHRSPGYAASAADWQGRLAELLTDLEGTLSDAQRAHLVGRIGRYARDFAVISGRRDTAAGP